MSTVELNGGVMNFPSEYKSAQLNNGVVTIERVPFPTDKLTANTVAIKPKYMGICRADVKEVTSSRDVMQDRGPLFGHEIVGQVVFAGKDTTFREDLTVTFNPNVTPERTTGFAEYFFIRGDSSTLQSAVISFPDEISEEPAFVPEPFACIIHSLNVCMQIGNHSSISGKSVGILGAGNSGILFGMLAKYRGARVKLFNRGEMRLSYVKQAGLFSLDEIDTLSNGESYKNQFDIVIVVPTIISQDVLQIASTMVKSGGNLHLYGGTRKDDTFLKQPINIDEIRRNERIERVEHQGKSMFLSGAYGCYAEDFQEVFSLLKISPSQFPLHTLISRQIFLDELPQTIEAMSSGKVDYPGKVLVRNGM